MISPFARFSDEDVLALIAEYPLAWVMPRSGDPLAASLLPLVIESADEKLDRLIGHLAKFNPLAAALKDDPRAVILFTGPQAYVSPGIVSRPQWAPTWNYAQLRIEAEISFDIDIDAALDPLTEAMERGRPEPWTSAQMGDRYARMTPAIIGFTAKITRIEGKFKLGQDEDATSLHEILDAHEDAAMVGWMKRMNTGR